MSIKAKLIQLFFCVSSAATPSGLSGSQNNAHPDEALYRNNPSLSAQRKVLMCEPEREKNAVEGDLGLIPPSYRLRRTMTYYFDFARDKPASSANSVRNSLQEFVGKKDVGFRLIGCATKSPNGSRSAYNKELSGRRIKSLSDIAKNMGVYPDRICEIPLGESCDFPESAVHVETFKIENAPQP